MRCAILISFLAVLQCANALTITADEAYIKPVGGLQQGVWNLWNDGEWGDFILVKTSGDFHVFVEAKGSLLQGVGPIMTLTVDGKAISSVEVKETHLKVFPFTVHLEPGAHRITLQYENDQQSATEDRNLFIASMGIYPAGGQGDTALGTEADALSEWNKQEAARETAALDEANAEIERERKENATITVKDAMGQAAVGATVTVEETQSEFLFGCNIFGFDSQGTPAENELYKQRFEDLFNFATTFFYWSVYEVEQGKPMYAYTDKVVAWCRDRHIRVKGHPLLWLNPAGVAPWIKGGPTPEQQRKRITDIVGRYRGQIDFWEVVNEPMHWTDLKVNDPYKWAREADPQARLIINDYDDMGDGNPAFYALLQKAIADRVPFEGIGLQSHDPERVGYSPRWIKANLEHYAQLGKDLYITEFTPGSGGGAFLTETREPTGKVWDEQTQADYAVRFYTMCFANPAVKGITWWDLCDKGSWRKNGGLLRPDLSPKPVYLALGKLIHDAWSTHAQGQTDGTGTYGFRGFRGDYTVTVQAYGKTVTREFALTEKGPNALQIALP